MAIKDNGRFTPEDEVGKPHFAETNIAAFLKSSAPDFLINSEARRFQQIVTEAAQWNAGRDYAGIFAERPGENMYDASLGFRTLDLLPEHYRTKEGSIADHADEWLQTAVDVAVNNRRKHLMQRASAGEVTHEPIKGRLVWSVPSESLTGGEVPHTSYGLFDIYDAPSWDYWVGVVTERTETTRDLNVRYLQEIREPIADPLTRHEELGGIYRKYKAEQELEMVEGRYTPPSHNTGVYLVSWVPSELAMFVETARWVNMSGNIGWLSGELTVQGGKVISHESVPPLQYDMKEQRGKLRESQIIPEIGFWAEADRAARRLTSAT